MPDVTRYLQEIENGDQAAVDGLFAAVYGELKQLAAQNIAGEQPGQTLCTSALVHEAYIRLVGPEGRLSFQNRRHLYGAAARAMRQVLVDAGRRRGRGKRGGGWRREEMPDMAVIESDPAYEALDRALAELCERDPMAGEIVDLHHFAGLSYDETAELLGISTYEVRQKWAFARAWLSDQIK